MEEFPTRGCSIYYFPDEFPPKPSISELVITGWQLYWCRDYRGGAVLNPSLLALWFSVLAAHWDHLGALEKYLDPDPTLDLVWGADRIRAGTPSSSHHLSCPC